MKVEKFENSNVDKLIERLNEILKSGGLVHQVLPSNQRAVYVILWIPKLKEKK